MSGSSSWSAANVLAIWLMWALMMAAMMLPSALPMILTFVQLALRAGERRRARGFVAAYLLVWFAFSAAATAPAASTHRRAAAQPRLRQQCASTSTASARHPSANP